jgi:hypothetical protein
MPHEAIKNCTASVAPSAQDMRQNGTLPLYDFRNVIQPNVCKFCLNYMTLQYGSVKAIRNMGFMYQRWLLLRSAGVCIMLKIAV